MRHENFQLVVHIVLYVSVDVSDVLAVLDYGWLVPCKINLSAGSCVQGDDRYSLHVSITLPYTSAQGKQKVNVPRLQLNCQTRLKAP